MIRNCVHHLSATRQNMNELNSIAVYVLIFMVSFSCSLYMFSIFYSLGNVRTYLMPKFLFFLQSKWFLSTLKQQSFFIKTLFITQMSGACRYSTQNSRSNQELHKVILLPLKTPLANSKEAQKISFVILSIFRYIIVFSTTLLCIIFTFFKKAQQEL